MRRAPRQVPVYIITGFMDSGKTKFITEMLEDDGFSEGERTLLIQCEEGEEEYSAESRHDSRNERAEEYAEEYGLIATGGSDCHRTEDIARSGILTAKVPSDSMGMMRLIRSRNFEIIR